jgi:hypothetical protein
VRVEEPCAIKVIRDRTIVIVRHSGRDRTGGIIGAGGEVSWPNRPDIPGRPRRSP